MPSMEITPELMDSFCQIQLEDIMKPKYSAQPRDGKSVKNSLKVEVSHYRTHIVVVARKEGENDLKKIHCIGGTPIGGYVYNSIDDAYYVNCVGYIELGCIPVSFHLKAEGSSFWKTHMPLPEVLIKRYLDKTQEQVLKNFKLVYKDGYTFEYIQCVE